jgi:hypothetical protein
MEQVMAALNWLSANWVKIGEIITSIIGVASIVIKILPTLPKDHWLLPLVKAIANHIALNKTVNAADRPVVTPPAK